MKALLVRSRPLFLLLALGVLASACSAPSVRESLPQGNQKPQKGAITWESG